MLPHELVIVEIMLLGMGATLLSDLWALFLKSAFNFAPSSMCLVGRWLLHMREGVFVHKSIASARQMRHECSAGWIAHYLIGVTFAVAFVAFAGEGWLHRPALPAALLFGVVTSLAPFFIMQPAFGLGAAASRAAHPLQARIRTLMNHAAFGIGLYLCGLLMQRWL
jgi:hypothetical protein